MRKKLVMSLALCAVGIAVKVKADDNLLMWRLGLHQHKVTNNISINSQNKMTISLPKGWSLWFEKDKIPYNPITINSESLQKYQDRDKHQGQYDWQKNTSPKVVTYTDKNEKLQSFIYNDNQGEADLLINVTVDSPSKKGEELALFFRTDEGVLGGTTIFKESKVVEMEEKTEKEQEIAKLKKQEEQRQIEKEQKHVEQKLLEDNMLKHIRENDHKTWYQRLGDNIEDTWANFKGWWRG
ncbi:hypothetical protein JavanS193_0001 [Streptococcus satellite phage Javan193]|nr:hypothetical protein JavanS193_0001 [Streptococcus satellite phage Javan193]QBX07824.1 hypothetical protein JavanS194_0001 [Streptococcus satellite phage Javan194]HEL0290808.1 hypothetical protein [Streptococcus equi subsp. zooepidemicus]HEL0292848.1 hypothetical protein [Streptococcus equi subsp. zooepidemicus]HEL0296844.1 hypothetical protein [Streptococcus equi subsp. zooepidemicus]